MISSIPLSELVTLALALAATGIVAGLLAGVFGIGGGGVIVPVLYQAMVSLGLSNAATMHIAVGSSLAFIIPTSIRSFRAHRARGAVDMDILKSWLYVVPAGVVVASIVAAFASGRELRAIFAVIALLVSLRLLFNRESWKLGDDVPGGMARRIAGFVIGFLSTLMGVGGGVMANSYFTAYGKTIHQAVATSSGVGVLIAIPGTIGYIIAGWGDPLRPPFSIGYVNLLAVALILPLSYFMAPLGARIAHSLKKRQLEVSFGLFLLLMSARFFYSLL